LGSGETILLETYKIQDDITFEIHARKQLSGREAYLHQTATVKVGLDTSLKAHILAAQLLDPTNDSLTAPRIIPYGATVEVELQNSQEGVDYRLVHFMKAESGQAPAEVTLSVAEVRGDLHHIVLTTQPVYEDTDIRIRAVKTFDPSENRPPQTALLDVALPLKVRANSALPVSAEPAPIIDFNQPATIKIAETQPNATYQLYIRSIPDRDFVHQAISATEVVKVNVAGAPDVQVRKPARAEVWLPPEGYVEGSEARPGTGGDLLFSLDPLADDSLIIVRAEKLHQVSQDPQTAQMISSAVQLEQPVVVLVRPDPAPALRVRVAVKAAETAGQLQLFGGQPGVFYHFRLDPEGEDRGLPAYFHQRDDQDERLNKGLGQLTVEVDFVIARPLPLAAAGANLAELSPEPPLLESGPLPLDANLYIRAVKGQTWVATLLSQPLQIPAGPEISPEAAVVDYGAKTRIRIQASRAGEWYQLLLAGNPVGEPVKGTGRDRLLDTAELTQDTTFEILVSQPDEPIVVERLLQCTVLVRPEAEPT
jgi:hypothetical protein